MRLKYAEQFSVGLGVATEHPLPCLAQHLLHSGNHPVQLLLGFVEYRQIAPFDAPGHFAPKLLIILGWILTWAAVELGMLQRLLDTTSLSGRQWVVVLALSLIAPAFVAVDKFIQLRRQSKTLAPEGS